SRSPNAWPDPRGTTHDKCITMWIFGDWHELRRLEPQRVSVFHGRAPGGHRCAVLPHLQVSPRVEGRVASGDEDAHRALLPVRARSLDNYHAATSWVVVLGGARALCVRLHEQ